ncbi:MAG: hypothetical protein VX196_02685, partial [Pseudomonadota bacterium]|nr:hypothetical protein [Pseudomonadota bacterium]
FPVYYPYLYLTAGLCFLTIKYQCYIFYKTVKSRKEYAEYRVAPYIISFFNALFSGGRVAI